MGGRPDATTKSKNSFSDRTLRRNPVGMGEEVSKIESRFFREVRIS